MKSYAWMLLGFGGCASLGELGSMLGMTDPGARQPASQAAVVEAAPLVRVPGDRRSFDPFQASSGDEDGSLWRADLQENYLFTRNLQFKVGDFVYVSLEPDLQEFMNQRLAKTMSTELQQAAPGVQKVVAEEAGKAAGDQVNRSVASVVKNDRVAEAVGGAVANQVRSTLAPQKKLLDISEMPMRVTAILPQGELKIEGSMRRMVENIPVEMKLAGRLREQDVGPSLRVASSRLMDSQMEFVK
jgi:flagellar basal body L-ring protein FlgH